MLRKFHLAKLAAEGGWEGIRRDEERFGSIPQEVREALPKVRFWGSGAPRREFLHVDDMAAAGLFVMQLSDAEYAQACADGAVSHLNVGCGNDHTTRALAEAVRKTVGFKGEVDWDSSRPDGMPRKLLDVSRLSRQNWGPTIGLDDGLRSVYQWYSAQV